MTDRWEEVWDPRVWVSAQEEIVMNCNCSLGMASIVLPFTEEGMDLGCQIDRVADHPVPQHPHNH